LNGLKFKYYRLTYTYIQEFHKFVRPLESALQGWKVSQAKKKEETAKRKRIKEAAASKDEKDNTKAAKGDDEEDEENEKKMDTD